MMSPTQQTRNALFEHTTSRRALTRAWLHVQARLRESRDTTCTAAAAVFAQDVERSIWQLQRELRAGSFVFAPQRGFLKGKGPSTGTNRSNLRPIVVAPVRNRIVQRAILDTCQTTDPRLLSRLGKLPAMIATPTSVGGLPGRGVPETLALISKAIGEGATWFVRSDIRSFFQRVPKPLVESRLRDNVRDERFVGLFMEALSTELANEEEVRQLLHLFPIGDIGVPQGSALSALCANMVLASFDIELNSRGICTIRYLDDFVILGPTKKSVWKAWQNAQDILRILGMECHDPCAGTSKASFGEIAQGFEYLSFHIDGRHIYPTASARREFLRDLRNTVSRAKREIVEGADASRRAEPRYIQSLSLLDRKIRGWGDAFSSTTFRLALAQLDAQIETLLSEYTRWFKARYRHSGSIQRRRLLGIAALIDTPPATILASMSPAPPAVVV